MTTEILPERIIDLRAWRLRAGYESMTEVARLIGYSGVSALLRFETGERLIPKERIPLLENLLGPDPPMMDRPVARNQPVCWELWWEYSVELTCPHCGRIYYWNVHSETRVRVTRVPHFRCKACRSPVMVSEITEERKRKPTSQMYVVPESEKPHVGRPRKRRD